MPKLYRITNNSGEKITNNSVLFVALNRAQERFMRCIAPNKHKTKAGESR